MKSNRKNSVVQAVLFLLIILNVAFIWKNSMVNATQSSETSAKVQELIQETVEFISLDNNVSNAITQNLIRKIAHFIEFISLAFLTGLFFRESLKKSSPFILLFGILVALFDETLQLFSVGRSSQITDVWLDSLGFLCGLLSCVAIVWCCNKNKRYSK